MFLTRIFHRTSFKHKLMFGICIFFLIYFFLDIYSSLKVGHLKIHILSFGNFSFLNNDTVYYAHDHGRIVTNRSGTFLNFKLPSLFDFNIERDFYKFINNKHEDKYCLRKGGDLANINEPVYCGCKNDYSGKECAIPPLIYRTIHRNLSSKIFRLTKPRRILLSLIWLTNDYSIANKTNKAIRVEQFSRALDSLSQYVDLFIIHEVILTFNMTRIIAEDDDQHSLAYQFKHDALAKHAQYSLLFSNIITLDSKTNLKVNLSKLEYDSMKKSWLLFTNRVTEYRSEDFLIFFSINNLPKEDLLLYLKYHAGLMDLIHLKPNYSVSVYTENGTLKVISMVDEWSDSKDPIHHHQPYYYDNNNINLKNIIVSFEFITYLCSFKFENFYSKLCLTDRQQIDHFEKYFWQINLVNIGTSDIKSNLSSTFTIE